MCMMCEVFNATRNTADTGGRTIVSNDEDADGSRTKSPSLTITIVYFVGKTPSILLFVCCFM